MKKIFLFAFLLPGYMSAEAQEVKNRIHQFADFSAAAGSSQATFSLSYVHNWRLGKVKKFEVGLGARWTTFTGSKVDFLTAAPAKYTRSFTAPFIIFFAGQKEENFDTLTVQRPLTHSINITLNLGYHIGTKWYAGFNIDAIGFTFGRSGSSVFTGHNATNGMKGTFIDPNSKPSSFNVLLTGDHDIGTLNSEFFIRYKLSSRIQLKALYQFIFVEYESNVEFVEQQIQDGPTNNRFRNKGNLFGLGLSFQL